MNYDLLKLSKILPTIKGKKTIEIYEESLEKIRQAQQAQQEEETSPGFYSPKSKGYNNRSAVGRAYIKLEEAKSAEKLKNGNLGESMKKYVNLQILLRGEETTESLTGSLRSKSKNTFEKGSPASTSASGFYSTRPNTSGVPPGNFVFKKQKISLRETEETLHMHHYALGTGFNFLAESPSSLKGRKVNVRETSTDLVVRQQKKYLKNLKQDPLTTFHSPNLDTLSNDLQTVLNNNIPEDFKRGSEVTSPTNKLLTYKQKMQTNSLVESGQKDSPKRMSTLTFDGTYLKSFDSKKAFSALLSPARSKNSSKGFQQ